MLLENASISEARVKSDKLIDAGCSFDILGANRDLAGAEVELVDVCLLYTSPSPRDRTRSRMPSSA